MMVREPDGTRQDIRPGQSGWDVVKESEGVSLRWQGAPTDAPCLDKLQRALESAFSQAEAPAAIRVTPALPGMLDVPGMIGNSRGLEDRPVDVAVVPRDMFYQCAEWWLGSTKTEPFPLHYVMTQGTRHPLRPSKPTGDAYRRHIPWLDKTLSFRAVHVDDDLATFHRWMNDPVVAHFWEEAGDLTHHHSYLRRIAEDKHTIGLIGCFDNEPFGYFEVYWAKEDRIAPFYEVADYDRGWHVLVGEEKYRGKPFLTAWMPSIAHYLFLADCRTQRIVIEPRADNHKMIKSLARCGYVLVKEFDFPHKRAMLGMLLRDKFFSEALWLPRS